MDNKDLYSNYDFSQLSESFRALIGSMDLMLQMLDLFPMPIEVFDPNGTAVYINRAGMDMFNIKDASLHIGKYNVLHDPSSDEAFGHDFLVETFHGKTISWTELSVPIQSVVDRGVAKEKPFEAAYMDVYAFPVRSFGRIANVIYVFILKRMYRGIPEVVKAKEYIDNHWREEFDVGAIARAIFISQKHLATLFKQNTHMKLIDYYKKVKVDHIKRELLNKSLSIAEVFSYCGEDNRGAFGRTFKELTGMTPKEYRNSQR